MKRKPVSSTTAPDWPDLNGETVRDQMTRDRTSKYWDLCYAYVTMMVRKCMLQYDLPTNLEHDIVQQAMEAIAKSLSDFRGDNDCRLTSWLTTVARNKVKDAQRSLIRNKGRLMSLNATNELEDEAKVFEIAAPGTVEEKYLMREKLRETIEKMREFVKLHNEPERNSLILRMALLDNLACEKIAVRLGIDCSMVHSVVYRFRQYLKEE